MYRAGLTAYLSLMLLANPSVCCCVSARLTDWLASFGVGTVQKQGHSLPTCCQRHPLQDGANPSVPTDPARPKPAEKTPCPCHPGCFHDLAKAADPAGAAQHHADQCQLDGLDASLFHSLGLSSQVAPFSPFGNAGAPSLTAQDLLRAHHNLLC
jgi:hypothetical protein